HVLRLRDAVAEADAQREVDAQREGSERTFHCTCPRTTVAAETMTGRSSLCNTVRVRRANVSHGRPTTGGSGTARMRVSPTDPQRRIRHLPTGRTGGNEVPCP